MRDDSAPTCPRNKGLRSVHCGDCRERRHAACRSRLVTWVRLRQEEDDGEVRQKMLQGTHMLSLKRMNRHTNTPAFWPWPPFFLQVHTPQ